MKVCNQIKCIDFPCKDIDVTGYLVPYKEINPQNIQIFMITEAPPADKEDYFYAKVILFICKQLFKLLMMPVSIFLICKKF